MRVSTRHGASVIVFHFFSGIYLHRINTPTPVQRSIFVFSDLGGADTLGPAGTGRFTGAIDADGIGVAEP